MSAPFFIPFNNNPASTKVETSSYTIPAGYYARITPLSPNLSINEGSGAVQMYPTDSIAVTTSSPNTVYAIQPMVGSAYVYSRSLAVSNYVAGTITGYIGAGFDSSANFVSSISRTSNGTTSNSTGVLIPSGSLLVRATSSGGSAGSGDVTFTVSYYYFPTEPQDLWVKSGATVDGARFIVTLYNASN